MINSFEMRKEKTLKFSVLIVLFDHRGVFILQEKCHFSNQMDTHRIIKQEESKVSFEIKTVQDKIREENSFKSFENYLYGDVDNDVIFDISGISDFDFLVDRIVKFPSLRPLYLERVVILCLEYSKNSHFRQKLLEKTLQYPVLIYRMYQRGVYLFKEIEMYLQDSESFVLSYYLRKEILDFESFIKQKRVPDDLDMSFLENEDEIDILIEYGFLPVSIEYCLKYDDVDCFRNFNTTLPNQAKWSPFEWSVKPDSLDLLSFSGFFGSIKCFKHLLLHVQLINQSVFSSVVCSGSLDLFHLCNESNYFSSECVLNASKFFQLDVLAFMIENGADINTKDKYNSTPLHRAADYGHLSVVEYLVNQKADINAKEYRVEFLYLIGLLFI